MQSAPRKRVANMLGGLSVAISDRVAAASAQAALVALDSHPDVSVAHLSRALGRSHSATVRLIDGLKRDGLVTREPGPDPRTVALRLTKAGKRAATAIRRTRAACLDELVDALSDEEVAGLEPALERLLASSASDSGSRWRICRLCEETRCEDGSQPCPVDAAAPR